MFLNHLYDRAIKPVEGPNASELWRNVGRLTYEKGEDSATYHATGTLINVGGAIGILTCAHAMWDPAAHAKISGGTFAPAYGAQGEPQFAAIEFTSHDILIASKYNGESKVLANDWAVIRVSGAPDGLDSAKMPQMAVQTSHSVQADIRITGYPTPSTRMMYSTGTVRYAFGGAIVYEIGSDHGFSGSAVLRVGEPQPTSIIGVHAGHLGGENERGAAMIVKAVADEITRWLKGH